MATAAPTRATIDNVEPVAVPEGYAIVSLGEDKYGTLYTARVIIPESGGYRELSRDGVMIALEHDPRQLLTLIAEHQRQVALRRERVAAGDDDDETDTRPVFGKVARALLKKSRKVSASGKKGGRG